jgi:hypothetical protein
MSTENNKDFQWTDDLVNDYVSRIVTGTLGFQHNHMENFKKEIGEKRHPEYEILSVKSNWSEVVYSDQSEISRYYSAPTHFAIHSVRRLSDGEVFQIGGKVQHVDGHYSAVITEFYLPSDERGEMWFYCDGQKDTVKNLNNFTNLPTPQPLFTTEDGVDIYEETVTLHGINTETWIPGRLHFSRIFQDPEWKWFAIPYNRDRYILMNKPTLSVNEVLDIFRDHEVFDELVSALHERAKAKL